MDAIEVIKKMIEDLKKEIAPTYCGKYEYESWEECRDAKIEVLEEVLGTIEFHVTK